MPLHDGSNRVWGILTMRNTALKILGMTVATAVAMSAAPAFAKHHHYHKGHGHAAHPGKHGVTDNVRGSAKPKPMHPGRHGTNDNVKG
jgi:hypothetical protein